jgi:anti-sigma factor ChrR (cupin superfamily)
MTADDSQFDDLSALALALVAGSAEPRPDVKARLMAQVHAAAEPPVPKGFSFRYSTEGDWLPHPVPGIRFKVLALNRDRGYATLLLDVAPGTVFPPHHHAAAEECYVVSGSLTTCGRRIHAGDFLHADGDTDHGPLSTDTGCRVLLVVPPEDYLPEPPR